MGNKKISFMLALLCCLLILFLLTYIHPVVINVTDDVHIIESKKEFVPVEQKKEKHGGHIFQNKDPNCISTIPQRLIDSTGESPIIIPEEEILIKLDLPTVTCLYHRYVQTLQRHCTRPLRVGNLGHGGWFVCTDPDAVPKPPCLVYSFSFSDSPRNYTSFVKEMADDHKCQVEMYSKEKTAALGFNHHVLSQDTTGHLKIRGIQSVLDNISVSKKNINVLAMDINNREWEVIPRMLKSGLAPYVEQLFIKLHSGRDRATKQDFIKRLVILRDLYGAGFRIFWTVKDETCLHYSHIFTGCHFIHMIRVQNSPSPVIIPDDPEFSSLKQTQYRELFDRYLTSVQVPCKQILRIGNLRDGGWNVCHDPRYRPRTSCLVYSFGINFDFSFDDDVANTYGCDVKSFDPSMNQIDHQHSEKVMFYGTGLSNNNADFHHGKDIWRMRTLKTVMEEIGQINMIIDILKTDVETSDWISMKEMIASGALQNVRQFAFEVHTWKVEDDAEIYKTGLVILRDLYKVGFRIFWSNPNSGCRFKTKAGKERTYCYEVYTLNPQLIN